jgi:hypothetical protein
MILLWQAVSLSEYFEQIIASDASREQIENAQPRNNNNIRKYFLLKGPLLLIVALISSPLLKHCIGLISLLYKEARTVLRMTADVAVMVLVGLSQLGLMVFIQFPQKLTI